MNPGPFLAHLETVAKSPYAFVAYLCVLGIWSYLVYSGRRLNAIQKLPKEDRAEVLKKEYGVLPRAGISAEQWIRARIHMFIFIGFLVVAVLGSGLSVVAMVLSHQDRPRQMGTLRVDVIDRDPSMHATGEIIVTVKDDNGNPYPRVHGEAAGRLTFFNLPLGDYTIEVNSGNLTVSQRFTLSAAWAQTAIKFP